MRLLALITDGFGGRGGIAKFNRDLLRALSTHREVSEVVALPRLILDSPGELPDGLTYVNGAAGGKLRFVRSLLRSLLRRGGYGGVVCGHMYLLPLAVPAARLTGAPLVLITHGIEGWKPTQGRFATALTRRLIRHVDALVTVSAVTRQRMGEWLPLDETPSFVVHNCIDAAPFGPGPKRADLLERYDLTGRTVLLTVARLSATERYKGVDEVMESLPALADAIPNLSYLICGDGNDQPRLEEKARSLGIKERVVFAGYIPEDEKADHYRLADAFVMPGRGEGFGIVYLEALACAVPVVASLADASREAVLDGELGTVVDPDDPEDVRRGILKALRKPRAVPEGLNYFSEARFAARWHAVIDDVMTQRAELIDHRPVPELKSAS